MAKTRKPGRPRAIRAEFESTVVDLYEQGNGYRAIARLLCNEYGVSADFTTVKRVLKRLGKVNRNENPT